MSSDGFRISDFQMPDCCQHGAFKSFRSPTRPCSWWLPGHSFRGRRRLFPWRGPSAAPSKVKLPRPGRRALGRSLAGGDDCMAS